MKIAVVIGTRPDIIKTAPVIKEIKKRKNMELCLVDVGQHYDDNMSDNFIKELHLPPPDIAFDFDANLMGQIDLISFIMTRIEYTIQYEKPDVILVTGDTNSALASALSASKMGVPIGHIEAGVRDFDKSHMEEINRVLIDHMSNMLFAPTPNCVNNMIKEDLHRLSKVYLTGHPLVDLIHSVEHNIVKPYIAHHGDYAFMTFHRRENISDKTILENILRNMVRVEHDNHIPIIFSIHPHTKKQIEKFGLLKYLRNFTLVDPLPYLDSLSAIKCAKFVITDSGGIIQEAAILGTPCISLVETTGWMETIWEGMNTLVGHDGDKIVNGGSFWTKANWKPKFPPDVFGKVGVSKRIVDIICHQNHDTTNMEPSL